MRYRAAVPLFLLAAGAVAVGCIFLAESVTWKAVWVGVASTALATGFVDGSAILETRQRERAVVGLVGVRVGQIHQRLLWIVNSLFDIPEGEAVETSTKLRQVDQDYIDLAARAAVVPERSKQIWAAECVQQIEQALDVARSLGALTGVAWRIQELDDVLQSGSFMAFLRNVGVMGPRLRGADVLAKDAADTLDAVQEQFRFFSSRGDEHWKFGQLQR